MYGFAYDGPPTKCSGGARLGTRALRDGVIERFGCGDLGIYNCRTVRVSGSSTKSFHADGRAWDAGCTGDLNRRIAQWLVDNANELGVQEVISYRRRWDARTRRWDVYQGDDDHTTHVHVAQCIRAANDLTLATVRSIDGGAPGPIDQEDDMTPGQWEFIQGMNKKLDWLLSAAEKEGKLDSETLQRVKEVQATQERELAED